MTASESRLSTQAGGKYRMSTMIEKKDFPPSDQGKYSSERELFPLGRDEADAASLELPRQIAGGFSGIAEDLDRASRDWTMMVRLLDHQRLQLETVQGERARLHAALEAVVPEARKTAKNLDALLERTKQGDVSGNLSAGFAENLREFDQLENIAKALTANLLQARSSWEQYARTVLSAQRMREKLKK